MMPWLWLLVDLTERNPYGHYHFLLMGIWLFTFLAACVLPENIHSDCCSQNDLATTSSKRVLFLSANLFSILYYSIFVICMATGAESMLGLSIFISTAFYIAVTYPKMFL